MEDGLSPGAGALSAALTTSVGKKPDYEVGKPNPSFVLNAIEELAAKPSKSVLIGDRLSTDILCGNLAKIFTILVETGVDEKEFKLAKPDLILNSIIGLFS